MRTTQLTDRSGRHRPRRRRRRHPGTTRRRRLTRADLTRADRRQRRRARGGPPAPCEAMSRPGSQADAESDRGSQFRERLQVRADARGPYSTQKGAGVPFRGARGAGGSGGGCSGVARVPRCGLRMSGPAGWGEITSRTRSAAHLAHLATRAARSATCGQLAGRLCVAMLAFVLQSRPSVCRPSLQRLQSLSSASSSEAVSFDGQVSVLDYNRHA